jgi:hypothetical protein
MDQEFLYSPLWGYTPSFGFTLQPRNPEDGVIGDKQSPVALGNQL